MNPFAYHAPRSVDEAIGFVAVDPDGSQFVAGGTSLIDLMKERLAHPAALVDINRLALAEIASAPDGGLHLGALARNADTADHRLVRERYPLLRAAILAGASPQIRNRASNGGNLLQRTRCLYFYDAAVPCNKHSPGSGCPAVTGLSRQNAILGASAHCVATHPSDMCVALAALDCVVCVRSPRGDREIAFADFHRLPGDTPDVDTTLAPDELITHLALPRAPQFARHCAYLKIRDRASYAFALVSVAAALDISPDGNVRDARVALGGVAHKPWRDARAEALLIGRKADVAAYAAAADLMLADAHKGGLNMPDAPPGNGFKITMARRAVIRALQMAQDSVVSNTGEEGARLMGERQKNEGAAA